ncbi:hypothetical protein BSLG_006077 [Batrachochytrium salamandrivorans]|nr:hypothetical protein BSLG_006077 [Batrachochytrium salamandrivorans]
MDGQVERLEHAAKNDQVLLQMVVGLGWVRRIQFHYSRLYMFKWVRSTRRTGINSDVVRTEADWQNVLNQLNNTNEAEQRQLERSAKEPDMIISPELRTSTKFINNNGLVHDPAGNLAVFNNKMNMCWSDEEQIFFAYYGSALLLVVEGEEKKRSICQLHQAFKTYLLKANEEIVHTSGTIKSKKHRLLAIKDATSADVISHNIVSANIPGPAEKAKALHAFDFVGRNFEAMASMVGEEAVARESLEGFSHTSEASMSAPNKADAPVGDDNATISHTGQGTDASQNELGSIFLQNATKSSSVTDAPEKTGPDRSNTPPLDAISAIAAAQTDSTNPAEESEVIDEGVSPNREMLDNSNQHQALRKTVSYWSVNERSEFLKSMSKYGRNWDTISKGIAVFMTETAAVEEAKESKIEAATKMGDATIACHGSSSNSNPISVLPSSSHPYSYFHPHEASQSHSTELPPYGAMAIDSSIHNDAPHHFPPIPRSISPHKPTVYHSAEHRVKQSAYAIPSQVNAEDPLNEPRMDFHAPISSSSSIGSYQGLENLPQHSHEHLTVVSSTDVGATVMHEHQHHNSVKETIYNESDNTKTGSSSTGWNLASTRSEQFCDTIPDQTLSNQHHFQIILQHGQQRNVHSQPLSQLELVTDQSSGFVHNAMPHQPTSTASFGLADTSISTSDYSYSELAGTKDYNAFRPKSTSIPYESRSSTGVASVALMLSNEDSSIHHASQESIYTGYPSSVPATLESPSHVKIDPVQSSSKQIKDTRQESRVSSILVDEPS